MAIRQEHTVVIERPIEEVFAFATDPDKASLWQSTSLGTKQTSEGPVGVGTTFRDTSKFLGRFLLGLGPRRRRHPRLQPRAGGRPRRAVGKG